MKRIFQISAVLVSLSLLSSCARLSMPKYEQVTDETSTREESTTKLTPETTVNIEPIARSTDTKKSHSYGVAKDGKANEISINAQNYFDTNNFKAFCLDIKSDKKVMYLTFDCGYENGYTAKILDVLKEKGVNAAFFCTLPQVKENPDLIKRMIDEGHIVGNHSVTHPSFAEISVEEMQTEIKGMEDYLKTNYNYCEPFFRFPKGEYSDKALRVVENLGYTSVFWSLAYADWDLNNQKGKDYAYEKVITRLHPGSVILLHSVSPDNANALPEIIDEARRQGYKFVSLRDYQQN